MPKHRGIVLLIALLSVPVACTTGGDTATDTARSDTTRAGDASFNRDAAADSIKNLDENWLRWATEKKVDSMLTLYDENAHSFMQGQKPVTDTEGRRRAYTEFVGMNLRNARLNNTGVEFSDDGTMAMSHGTYSGTMTMGGREVSDEGSYLNVYKRTPSGWKYIAEMSHSSMPMAPPPAPTRQ